MRRTAEAMRETEGTSAWDEPARLNQHGELEPIAVDESLTILLFTARPAQAGVTRPARPLDRPLPAEPPRESIRSTVTLFEMV